MKKLIFLLGVILLCYSCSKSRVDLIKEELKIYVNENIADPNYLKDIVSIELKDSITNEKLHDILNNTYKVDLVTDSFDKIVDSVLISKPNEWKNSQFKQSSYLKTQKCYELLKNLVEKSLEVTKSKSYRDKKHNLDSMFFSLDTICVYEYVIKCRVLDNKEFKLKNYYAAITDTSTFISDKEISPIYFNKTKLFWEKLVEYHNAQKEYGNNVNDKAEITYELVRIIEELRK